MNPPLLRRPFPKKLGLRPKPLMTIAIGFVCKNAVAILSDSQMSAGKDFKQFGTPKVFPVHFGFGLSAIVGFSGTLDSANLFREILESDAEKTVTSKPNAVVDAVESAIKQTKLRFLRYIEVDNLSEDGRNSHLDYLNFNVIFAYYHEGKPCLYSSGMFHGSAIRCHEQFLVTGCGADIASYVLNEYNFTESWDGEALGMVYYAIETCKRYSQGCGGEVQHFVLQNGEGKKPVQFSPERMDIYRRAFDKAGNIVHQGIENAIERELKRTPDNQSLMV